MIDFVELQAALVSLVFVVAGVELGVAFLIRGSRIGGGEVGTDE